MAQHADDGTGSDLLHGVLLKEKVATDAVFHVESATGDGQMNVRMLVELATVCV